MMLRLSVQYIDVDPRNNKSTVFDEAARYRVEMLANDPEHKKIKLDGYEYE